MSWLTRLRAMIPTRAQIRDNRWLRWLSPWLRKPRLWRWSRRGVAMGVALGMFFGLLVPVAQIPLSVGAAILLRANVPAAAASTLVTNPLTFGPLYYAAYQLGDRILGESRLPALAPATPVLPGIQSAAIPPHSRQPVWSRISALGKPLLLGLAILATLMGLLSYAITSLAWHGWTWFKRRRRRQLPGENSNGPGSA
ncbi:MAG TPA: DUF2062 domain-containing protein [Burkholderiaceae bacterium]|nr:DUF2062 domain-containing protein [Burkholderiaceae bacterium]